MTTIYTLKDIYTTYTLKDINEAKIAFIDDDHFSDIFDDDKKAQSILNEDSIFKILLPKGGMVDYNGRIKRAKSLSNLYDILDRFEDTELYEDYIIEFVGQIEIPKVNSKKIKLYDLLAETYEIDKDSYEEYLYMVLSNRS